MFPGTETPCAADSKRPYQIQRGFGMVILTAASAIVRDFIIDPTIKICHDAHVVNRRPTRHDDKPATDTLITPELFP
jgi:hypothetical protein